VQPSIDEDQSSIPEADPVPAPGSPLPLRIPIMAEAVPAPQVEPVSARDSEVTALLDALTSELKLGGYEAAETFGYSVEQLESSQVYLVGARAAGRLVGVGGVERQDSGIGELKRFFVLPEYRGTGVADALITALIEYAPTTVSMSCGSRQATSSSRPSRSTDGTGSSRFRASVLTCRALLALYGAEMQACGRQPHRAASRELRCGRSDAVADR
jgi:GNAT superfamily N-acetyltransferase